MLFKEIERIGEPPVTNLDPAIYNLLKDPKEQERLRHYIEDTWVEAPLYRVLEEHFRVPPITTLTKGASGCHPSQLSPR